MAAKSSVLALLRFVPKSRHYGAHLIRNPQGAASFAKKTVFGVTDSMTKVTSSISKGQNQPGHPAKVETHRSC